MPRRLAAALTVALALGGCGVTDCTFDPTQTVTDGTVLLADGRGLGDSLTVAFVRTPFLGLDVAVDGGVEGLPGASPDEAVALTFDAVVDGFRAPEPLAATTRGDTVFVYVVGTVDPLTLACSPPALDRVAVRLRALEAPAGVVDVRVAVLDADALSEPAAAALRQSDADRRRTRTITT